MNVTHVIIGLEVGGAELMLKRLVEALDGQENMHHSVVSLTSIGPIGIQLQQAGIEVVALNLNNPLNLPAVFIKLRNILKKKRTDIVQTWMYHADLLGGLAARSLGIKNVVWNVRNTHLYSKGFFKILFREFLSVASWKVPKKIIYVSHSAQKEHAKYGFRINNSEIIGNGFDTNKLSFDEDRRTRVRVEIGLEDTDIAVFSIGRYNHAKDHETFIKSICLSLKKNKFIKGVLIGREIDLDEFKLTEEQRSHFIILGQRDDVPALLSAADIFCLHSITEGFPNVLGEAMSAQLPCITTRAGDAEIILDDADYTVEVRDFSEMSNKILELSKMSEVNRRIKGSLNRKRILDNYSLDKILSCYTKLYKELL